MKRRAYCCDASRDLYEEYYSRQNGGEIPVFAGRQFQRGHGLGSILGGFFRRLVLPFFKTHGKRAVFSLGNQSGSGTRKRRTKRRRRDIFS